MNLLFINKLSFIIMADNVFNIFTLSPNYVFQPKKDEMANN